MRHSVQRRPVRAAIGISLLAAAALAPALARAEAFHELGASARAIAQHDFGRGEPVVVGQPHAVSVGASDERGFVGDSGSAWARGSSSPGLLQLHTQAQASASGLLVGAGVAGGQSTVFAAQTDSFVIAASGCGSCGSGSLGRLSFAIWIAGGANASVQPPGPGMGSYEIDNSWSGGLQLDAGALGATPLPSRMQTSSSASYQDFDGVLSSAHDGPGNGLHTFSISFAFGSAIALQWSAQASASAYLRPGDDQSAAQGTLRSSAGLLQGIAWAGIVSVSDAHGQPVGDFSALNGEGVSYAQSFASAVPEPGEWALMAAGLLALAGWQRRRREDAGQDARP